MYSVLKVLAPLVLVQISLSRPIIYSTSNSNSNLKLNGKRTLTIIEAANRVGAVVAYVSCQMAGESFSAVEALGSGKGRGNVKVCIEPPGMNSSPYSPSPSTFSITTSAAIVPAPTSTPVNVPSLPQPVIITSPRAPVDPITVVINTPTPFVAPGIFPVVQPDVVSSEPDPSPLTSSSSPTLIAPTSLSSSIATPMVIPVSPPVIVATPYVNPLIGSIPAKNLTATPDELNTCISGDPEVCYQQDLALSAHNVARRAHHVPDLIWNNDLAAAALKWANHCTWGHSGGKLFPSSYVYGENIFASSDPESGSSMAILAYTNEESVYNYDKPGYSEVTGHFTQVVWKDTREVGCAIIDCNLREFRAYTNSSSFSVCEYYPSGNWSGEFSTNVFKP